MQVKKEPSNETNESKEPQKTIYSIFFQDSDFDELEKFLERYNLTLHKSTDETAFSITYSTDNLVPELIEMAKEIRQKFKGISMIIHSEVFENKISSVSAALITKNLISRLEGFFITEQIAQKLKNSPHFKVQEDKCFKVKERVIKLYSVYKR